MELNDKLKLAMRAGAHAIINGNLSFFSKNTPTSIGGGGTTTYT